MCLLKIKAPSEHKQAAVNYAENHLGQLFYPVAFKPGERIWNCTKIVWEAYRQQGMTCPPERIYGFRRMNSMKPSWASNTGDKFTMTTIILKAVFYSYIWLAGSMAGYALSWSGFSLAIMYLLIISAEIRSLRRYAKGVSCSSFLIWQAPGIVFSLISSIPWSWWGLKE